MESRQEEMISIIMPVFNAENTVGRTISSILNQSMQNFELIIVDDGSTDGTAGVCAQFDSGKIVCCRQENAGPAAARNTGLAMARGSLICFVDSDDTVREDYLQVLSDCIEGADLAVCAYNEVTDDGISAADIPESPWTAETPQASCRTETAEAQEAPDTVKTAETPQASCRAEAAETPPASCRTETADSLMEMILHDDTIGGFLWNKIFRKSLIVRGGIAFSKNIFVGEDLLFVEQYLAGCRTVRITDQKLYNYYTSGDSISSAMNEKTLTLLRALEKISGLSDRPSFAKAAAVRYVRQFLSFAAYFPDRQCPPGRLSSFLKNTGLTRKEVFAGLTNNYKIKYVLYHTNRTLYRKVMSSRKKAEKK